MNREIAAGSRTLSHHDLHQGLGRPISSQMRHGISPQIDHWKAPAPGGERCWSLPFLYAALRQAHAVELHVAPDGNDASTGRAAVAMAAKTDGPFATLERAHGASPVERRRQTRRR